MPPLFFPLQLRVAEMSIEWATRPVRVSVCPEGRSTWVEFETESFVTRYLVPGAVADWLASKLLAREVASREVTGDDLHKWR